MGQSTDAILFYGILIPEGMDCPWRDADIDWHDFEDVLSIRLGLPQVAWADAKVDKAQNKAWLGWLGKRNEMVKQYPVTLGRHCCPDDPMWYLAIKDLHWRASRGSPRTFPGGELPVAGWQCLKLIKDACELMGIVMPEDAKPGWHLVSDWS